MLKYLVFLTVFWGVYDADPAPRTASIRIGEKKYFVNTVEMLSFFGAHHYCRLLDMHLAAINSQEEHQKLGKFVEDMGLEDQGYWIGGNNLMNSTFEWLWMSSGGRMRFTAWAKGEPNNSVCNENCMEFLVISPDGTFAWNDHNCNQKKYFICEKFVEV